MSITPGDCDGNCFVEDVFGGGSGDVLDENSFPNTGDNIADFEEVLPSSAMAAVSSTRAGAAASTSAPATSSPFQDSAWIFEWRPSLAVGAVKIPLDVALRRSTASDSSRILNILDPQMSTTSGGTLASTFENLSEKSLFLPMNSTQLVLLEDVSLSRKLITNNVVTQGTKYYQVFTEGFPEISVTLQAVKFGGISDRVVEFFDTVTTFSGNPRRHPGSFYLYDVFGAIPTNFTAGMLREGAHRKYKIIPVTVNKSVTSRDNMMLKIVVTGTVVEWEQNA